MTTHKWRYTHKWCYRPLLVGTWTSEVEEELMSAGLFALSCPTCGTELEVKHDAVGACTSCRSSFLIRFGHLIPVGPSTPAEPVAVLAEG
jgi:hypothetical protein